MTQDDLAKRLETTKQTVYKYENDIITNIPLDKIEIMAHLFNVRPAFITGWDDTPPDALSTDEQALLDKYRTLNPTGKERLMEQADLLAASPVYTDSGSQQQVG